MWHLFHIIYFTDNHNQLNQRQWNAKITIILKKKIALNTWTNLKVKGAK